MSGGGDMLEKFIRTNGLSTPLTGLFHQYNQPARQSPLSSQPGSGTRTPTGGPGLRRTDSAGRVNEYRHHGGSHGVSAWPTQPPQPQQQQPPPPQQPLQHLHSSHPLPAQHSPSQPPPPPEPAFPPAGVPAAKDPQPPRPPPPGEKKEVVAAVAVKPKEAVQEQPPPPPPEALKLADLKLAKGEPADAFVEELPVMQGSTVVTDTGDLGTVEAVEGGTVCVKTQGGFWLTRPRGRVSRARLFVLDPYSVLAKPAFRPVIHFLRTHGRIATWGKMSNSIEKDLQQMGLAKDEVELSFGKDDLVEGRKQLSLIWDNHPWAAPDTVMLEERRDVATHHEANTIFTPPESGDAKDKDHAAELLRILKDLTKSAGDTRVFIASHLKGNWKDGRWTKLSTLPVPTAKPAAEEPKAFRFDPEPLTLEWPPAELRQGPPQEPPRKAAAQHPAKAQHRPEEKKKQQVSQVQPAASAAKGVSTPGGRGAGKKQQLPQPRPGGRGAGRGKN